LQGINLAQKVLKMFASYSLGTQGICKLFAWHKNVSKMFASYLLGTVETNGGCKLFAWHQEKQKDQIEGI